jgi:diguanylate cyclase (GGDEF)-like protein
MTAKWTIWDKITHLKLIQLLEMNPIDRALIEKNDLFNDIDFESVKYMLEHSTLRTLNTGERLIEPDSHNQHLHLILEGSLSVHLLEKDSQQYTTLGAGECVGEISIVDGKFPSAFVAAVEPSRILSIPLDSVWSMLNNSHQVAGNLLGILVSRMRNDNQAIINSTIREKIFEQQAYIDALTGVYNRHWMNKAFPRTIQRCMRNKDPFAVMVIDIDHFKKINDAHGHQIGDFALKSIARCVQDNLRPQDLLVRYGGEEFAVLLADANLAEITMVAERLRSKVEAFEIRSREIDIRATLSIGITMTQDTEDLDHLIHEADQALYLAKQQGRNRIEIFQ